jgi:hypothetical protein
MEDIIHEHITDDEIHKAIIAYCKKHKPWLNKKLLDKCELKITSDHSHHSEQIVYGTLTYYPPNKEEK